MKTLTISDWYFSSLLWLKTTVCELFQTVTKDKYVSKQDLVDLQKEINTLCSSAEKDIEHSMKKQSIIRELTNEETNVSIKNQLGKTVVTSPRHNDESDDDQENLQDHELLISQQAWAEAAEETNKLNISIDSLTPFEESNPHEVDSIVNQYCILDDKIANEIPEYSGPVNNDDLNSLLKAATASVTNITDSRRYYYSYYYPLGMSLLGGKSNFPLLVIDGQYNLEVEDLLRQRQKKEPYVMMGTKAELQAKFKRLKDSDFTSAITMKCIREQRLVGLAAKVSSEPGEAVHLFRHWFCHQVNTGKIKYLDGHLFTDLFDEQGALVAKADTKPEDFLYCHFDSLLLAKKVKYGGEYNSVEHLAQTLMQRILEHSFGIRSGEITTLFELPNFAMKSHSPSGKVNGKDFKVVGKSHLKTE